MLTLDVRKLLGRHRYPQIVFAGAIKQYIATLDRKVELVIDCPCGTGETSWNLAGLEGVRIVAADISSESVRVARRDCGAPNIEFRVQDIETLLVSDMSEDVFCLINSLFLFPDAEAILGRIRDRLRRRGGKSGILALVIPNTRGKNFRWFQANYPGQNRFTVDEENIHSCFEALGFRVDQIRPIAYAHHFDREDVRVFSVFWPFYLAGLNFIQSTFRLGTPNYFLVALHAE